MIEEGPRIKRLRRIVRTSTAGKVKIGGGMEGSAKIDLTTASMLCAIYDAFKEDTSREKFDDIRIDRLINFGWEHVRNR